MTTNELESQSNVVGAIVFFSYIAAALILTGVVVYDNWTFQNARSGTPQRAGDARRSSARLTAGIFLVIISFSTLSYHMLSFLLVSYTEWAQRNRIPSPKSLMGDNSVLGLTRRRTDLFIWEWASSSNLFQDFAEAICTKPSSYFWAQKELLYSFVWNTYMAENGTARQLPRLWAYFALNQILPVSFSQNLFLLACQQLPPKSSQSRHRHRKPQQIRSWLTIALYYIGCLIAVPRIVGGPIFIPGLFATRILLLSPLLLKWTGQKRTTEASKSGEARTSVGLCRTQTITLALATVLLEATLAWKPASMHEVVKALNDNYAVKALGYDFLIGLASTLTSYMLSMTS